MTDSTEIGGAGERRRQPKIAAFKLVEHGGHVVGSVPSMRISVGGRPVVYVD